jgi:hypothetical protein
VDAAGDVFVTDPGNHDVREVLPDDTIKTLSSGFPGARGVAVDAFGDVFVADPLNHDVREVLPDGTIKTIGSGFTNPTGVAVDASGDVFVADVGARAVWEVLPSGGIKTIGSGFMRPQDVKVDGAGDVFVADVGAGAVKEVLPNGTIIPIASGFSQLGVVAPDGYGDVFVSDGGSIKEVLPDGTIKPIASGFSQPLGIAVDAVGDVFVADYFVGRVFELSPPAIAVTPSPETDSLLPVTATLTGLTPGTTYYYRLVSSGIDGTFAGLPGSFKTLGASTRGTSLAVPVRVAQGANPITHKGVSAKKLAKPAAGMHSTTVVSRGARAQHRPASSTLVHTVV